MGDKRSSEKQKTPPAKPQAVAEDPAGLITSYIRMVDEVRNEYAEEPNPPKAERKPA
jgi:hypothetical protein